MDNGWIKYLINLISKNKKEKQREFDIINQFEDLYNIINYYEPQQQTYEQMIETPESRLQFLANAITVAIDNGNMDENTINIVLQMFDNLYEYFYKESELQDIEIPQQIKQKMFISNEKKTELLIPNSSSIMFLITLIRENKRIYEEEFNGKDLSNKIKEGLHTNITEVLSIESKDVSHMLGLNNSAHSLYEFYRKSYIDNQIAIILNQLNIKCDNDFTKEAYRKFNEIFRSLFGLDYNAKNYEKLINLKYDEIDKDLSEKNITEEQATILKRAYDLVPKSKAVEFYCQDEACGLLIRECAKNSDFVYEYVRKEIIAKRCQTEDGKNKILEKFAEKELKEIDKKIEDETREIDQLTISSQEKSKRKKEVKKKYMSEKKTARNKYMLCIDKIQDFSINSNKKEIRNLIEKYIEMFGNTLKSDNDFQKKFKQKFGYKYPLIDYYEILGKNISFYNFSLLKNLNSIIVDYDYNATSNSDNTENKRPKVDTFLVSYAKKKITTIKDKVNNLIQKKDNDFKEKVSSVKTDVTDDYIASLKSLMAFPVEDRYYFRFGFTSATKRNQDDKIIEKESNCDDLISLMGFKTTEEEKNRISILQGTGITPFSHVHKFNTNITSNYHKYVTDYTRFGIEYPIDMIFSEDLNKKRILKLGSRGSDELKKYVDLFNNYQYNLEIGYQRSQEYEKYLIKTIASIVDGYKKVKEARIKALQYKKSIYSYNINEVNKYDNIIQFEELSLNKFITYCDGIKKYFKQYEELFDKSLEELQVDTFCQMKRK